MAAHILVAGDPTQINQDALMALLEKHEPADVVVAGSYPHDLSDADLAGEVCAKTKRPVAIARAGEKARREFAKHGAHWRNAWILHTYRPVVALVFGEPSKGWVQDLVSRAEAAGIPVSKLPVQA